MYSTIKVKDCKNDIKYREFVCDLLTDVRDLPTAICTPGSTAFIIEDSSIYMLGNDGVWHEI